MVFLRFSLTKLPLIVLAKLETKISKIIQEEGVCNYWTGIWKGTVEWTMEWNE